MILLFPASLRAHLPALLDLSLAAGTQLGDLLEQLRALLFLLFNSDLSQALFCLLL
jgi:hypothetical protein